VKQTQHNDPCALPVLVNEAETGRAALRKMEEIMVDNPFYGPSKRSRCNGVDEADRLFGNVRPQQTKRTREPIFRTSKAIVLRKGHRHPVVITSRTGTQNSNPCS
jgi:hypothetical protein